MVKCKCSLRTNTEPQINTTSPALCLGNPIQLDVTFWETAGGKSGLAPALRSVECGVCLRGEKICHFRVVVWSNVRGGAPMRGFYAPPYLPPFRPPFPSTEPPHYRTRPAAFHKLGTLPNTTKLQHFDWLCTKNTRAFASFLFPFGCK